VKFLKFQELGNVNEAFENNSEQRDKTNNFLPFNGVPTIFSTDEPKNSVFIAIIH
jgi:hypothetical protein